MLTSKIDYVIYGINEINQEGITQNKTLNFFNKINGEYVSYASNLKSLNSLPSNWVKFTINEMKLTISRQISRFTLNELFSFVLNSYYKFVISGYEIMSGNLTELIPLTTIYYASPSSQTNVYEIRSIGTFSESGIKKLSKPITLTPDLNFEFQITYFGSSTVFASTSNPSALIVISFRGILEKEIVG